MQASNLVQPEAIERARGLLLSSARPNELATFTMIERGAFQLVYAPFDHVNVAAKVIIVGLTPGRYQAERAALAFKGAILRGSSETDALAIAKKEASFSGPMRSNLIALLDGIGLNRHLGVSSCSEAFEPHSDLCHFTSAIRYPLYLDGKNYSGTPAPAKTPWMLELAKEWLGAELRSLPGRVVVPLGPKVAEVLQALAQAGFCEEANILEGLPHPSGANAERIAYFLGRKSAGALSAKTNADSLDRARARLEAKIALMARVGSPAIEAVR